MDLKPSDSDQPFELKRQRCPVCPAIAVDINKAQGQTLQCFGLYLPIDPGPFPWRVLCYRLKG